MKITVGIADDQQLFLKSLATLINAFDSFEVIIEACDGQDLLNRLAMAKVQPEILLIDVTMPVMDGFKTAEEVFKKYPLIKMTALSSMDDDPTILRMIRAHCRSYLLKDIHPLELQKALLEIYESGYYNGDEYNRNHRRFIEYEKQQKIDIIKGKELQFLQLACTDDTYKAIASKMKMAERTIDGYRESLFRKLSVQSRVGMVMEALRRGLVTLNPPI